MATEPTSGPGRVCGRPLAHVRAGRKTCRVVISTDYAQACRRHETAADLTVSKRLERKAMDAARAERQANS